MASGRKQSIARRLTMMNMLVSGIALLLACAGFFAYDQVTFRAGLVHTLSAQAQIIASNSDSAILFGDPQAAFETLSALKSSPHVASAGILTMDQRPFAQYARDTNDELISLPSLGADQIEASRFGSTHVFLIRKIMSEGRPVGFVYIRADLRELDERLKRYAIIAVAVLAISLFVAMIISSAFSRSVAQPIIHLAEIARGVSRNKDFGVRVTLTGEQNELAVLIESFNEMLQEIQQRDSQLQKAHGELEQRVAERTRELVLANRELEAFSYSVSHDLLGPLDALNGFSYLLSKQYGASLEESGKQLIEHIRASGKRMVELIDDLLNLSRITTSVMQAGKVDLSEVARSVIGELRQIQPHRSVEIGIFPTPEAQGDARLLRIVIENLLRNSWKYTSTHSAAKIEFASQLKDGQVVYFVRDDGVGFDPRSVGRLFQPFQRLHSSAEFTGNGIGLATVQRIVRRHGGDIWAEGAIEKGSTFYFTLPSSEARSAVAAPNFGKPDGKSAARRVEGS